jgi:hypothetical protein
VHLLFPWVHKLACQLYNHTRLRLPLEPMQAPWQFLTLKNSSGPVRARIWGSTTLLITAYLTDCCRRVDFRHARHTFFQACAALWGDGADVLPWGGDGADALRLGDGAETLPSICSRLCRCAFVQCNHDGPASTGQNPEKCQWIEFEQRSMRCSSMLHACAANVTANVILKHARQKTYVRARKSFAVSHEPSQGCFCCRSVGLVRST